MTARNALRSAAVALAVLAASGAASAQSPVAARLDDLRLATAVRLALVGDARTRTADVDVTAREGAVVLAGEVAARLRPSVVSVARGVQGVRSVSGLGAGDAAGGPAVEIPNRPAPIVSPPAGAAYHTVTQGDTLFSLARRYGTTVEAIQRLNGLGSAQIEIGQRLRIR